ncbi:MAG TPA: hypothetical protein ENI23_15210 [bacterium]|nr:hypothetical protein [bacterium]
MAKVIDDVIDYIKSFTIKGFRIEWGYPPNPEQVLVYLDQSNVIKVLAKPEILNKIRMAIENN